jgi:uncharacterized protein
VANRLADATSPYLLQHKDNPVDWREWTSEAFDEAEERGVPVLLSVGYAACHWCHVMAHESFENETTAAYMNEHFVCIKVDREERPDVDAVYMEATQAMTGQGGWPMTAFLTPAGEPFYCGTYFPPQPRYGMPSFGQLMTSVVTAWTDDHDRVQEAAAHIVAQLDGRPAPGDAVTLSASVLDDAVDLLAKGFDAVNGGFGGAPKFPPSMVLEWLLRHAARTGSAGSLAMVERTADAMARGGMYDQLAGGFARYSTDASWVVPHFEKMLYDNALLLRVYAHLWRQAEDPAVRQLARRITVETAEFLVRDLGTPEGGFASALDADTEGEEGRYYVWTPEQLVAVLGHEDGEYAAGLYNVTAGGTFEHGRSVLQLLQDPADPERAASVRLRLLQSRATRVAPARDDKVVAAWNGLAIAGLAEAGVLCGRADFVEAAEACATLLERLHVTGDGRLLRTSRDDRAGRNAGVLEDHGDLAEGLLVLASVTSDKRWVDLAGSLLDAVLEHFGDASGGFFDTADDAEALIRRPQDPTDNATPSGAAAVTTALIWYAALTGSDRHREAAEASVAGLTALLAGHPRFAGWAGVAAEALLAGPAEVAIVGALDNPRTAALIAAAWGSASPGAVVAIGDPDREPYTALLVDRPLVGGGPAAYVCRRMVCRAPVTTAEALTAELSSP